MSTKPRVTEPTRSAAADDAERERVVAKIERGLADVAGGRVIPHAEVLERIEARYAR